MINKVILHLSHTDIRFDSRILKEIRALVLIGKFKKVFALGVKEKPDKIEQSTSYDTGAEINSIWLLTGVFYWLPRPMRYLLNLLELTPRMVLKGLILRPSVIHCHDTFVLPAGLLLKWLIRSRLIYDAHELESQKNHQSKILSIATLLIEKISWSSIDLVISVSESIIEWYKNKFGAKKSLLILNSPETLFLGKNSTKSYFHKLYRISEGRLIFVYLGILCPGRGINLILDVFSSTKLNADIVFIGNGELTNNIKKYTEKYKNIHLHDLVPHEQVVPLVQNADVGLCLIENVSLSDYFSLPNKLFEYSFAGLKVLGSNFPEIGRIINSYGLGVCCPPNVDGVQNAIKHIIDNPSKIKRKSINELSWDAQAKRLVASYKEIFIQNT